MVNLTIISNAEQSFVLETPARETAVGNKFEVLEILKRGNSKICAKIKQNEPRTGITKIAYAYFNEDFSEEELQMRLNQLNGACIYKVLANMPIFDKKEFQDYQKPENWFIIHDLEDRQLITKEVDDYEKMMKSNQLEFERYFFSLTDVLDQDLRVNKS